MRTKTLLTTLLLAGFFVLPTTAQNLAGPQVWVDQTDRDYYPDEPVGILGSGFSPNSSVSVVVDGIDGTDGHWDLSPVITDENGGFSCTFGDLKVVGGQYMVTASQDASVAYAYFTDGGSFDYTPAAQTLNPTAGGVAVFFIQYVTAPKNNGSFTASLKVAGTGTYPIPASWVSTSPAPLSFVTTSSTGDTESWTVTFTVPAGTPPGTYTAQIKSEPSITGVGQGSGTAVTLVVGGAGNTAPVVNAGVDQTIDEGDTFSSSGSFVDGGADTWTATVDYGDSTGVQTLTLSGQTFSLSHVYADNGSYTVIVTVADNHGGSGSDTATVTVNNVPPAITSLSASPATINENDSSTLSGSFTDPGTLDTHTVSIDWGDGSSATTVNLAANVLTFSASHQYLDDDPSGTSSDVYEITVTVTDKDEDNDDGSTSVTVNNIPPTITGWTVPLDPMMVNSAPTVTLTFTDVGTIDTHTCTVSWDDGTSSSASLTESGGSGSCTTTHQYPAAGVYTLTATVTDDDTGTVTSTCETLLVVFDPSAGFVTGGGWIMSPAGAYRADPTLTGKANFGFVSKYKKGANVPDGNTEFQFKAGNLNFHSSSYQWLVVAGAKAQYKGTGTINGAGTYGFILTATDGNAKGGGGVDKFRIKIWDGAGVVYDNALDSSDDIDAANPQEIGGGSIVVHS